MSSKLLYVSIASILVAYYVYLPLPENIEERWKVMFLDMQYRTLFHVAEFSEMIGLKYSIQIMNMILSTGNVPPESDENVTVTDTTFINVPVRLFVSRKSSNVKKRALIYFHGGGWCSGSPAMKSYDLQSRWTADRLNAVVVSVDYRLAPVHHFPAAFQDVYTVSKYFLQKDILAEFNVDPDRIGVSGDSAGGNLAAAVAQKLQDDPEVKVKIKIQALIYPALQAVDLDTPSYRDNGYMPILKKRVAATLWSQYFTSDKSLNEAMNSNTHITSETSNLIKFANWSKFLPEELKKDHVYIIPQGGKSEFIKKYPGIIDPRASPLLVDNVKLSKLPITYILTCMYDVLRDDGFMYASRLKEAGVQVMHDHYANAFHGILALITWPSNLSLGHRMLNNYINWLNENL